MTKPRKSDVDEFLALADSQKDRILKEIEAQSTQELLARSRPLNPREREQWRRFKARAAGNFGRSKSAKTVSLTVEETLLKSVDAYAKRHGITRSRLIAQVRQAVVGSAA